MNDMIRQLATFAPALVAQLKGNPDALAEFTRGYQTTLEQQQQMRLREQAASMAVSDRETQQAERERMLARQAEQDQIAGEERNYGKYQDALKMLGQLVPAQETMEGAESMSQGVLAGVPPSVREMVAPMADAQLRQVPQMITGRQKKAVEAYVEAALKTSFVADNPDHDPELAQLPEHIAKIIGKPSAKLSELQQFAQLPVGKPAGKPAAEKPDFTLGDTRYRADGTPIVTATPKPEKPARTGYRFLVGADGEPFEWPSDQPAPRGAKPYDAVAARNKPDAAGPSPYAAERAARTVQSVDELIGKVGGWTTGMGSLLAAIPSTDARNFRAQLETLKANIAFNELTAMREASKTGGALGAVSDKEATLLQSALGALDAGQSPADLKAQLQKIKDSVLRWQAAQGQTASAAPAAPMADPLGIRKKG